MPLVALPRMAVHPPRQNPKRRAFPTQPLTKQGKRPLVLKKSAESLVMKPKRSGPIPSSYFKPEPLLDQDPPTDDEASDEDYVPPGMQTKSFRSASGKGGKKKGRTSASPKKRRSGVKSRSSTSGGKSSIPKRVVKKKPDPDRPEVGQKGLQSKGAKSRPSFPNPPMGNVQSDDPSQPHSSRKRADRFANGLVVWARMGEFAWWPGRVEWTKQETLSLNHTPIDHDPGPNLASTVPVRWFGQDNYILDQVPRARLMFFDGEVEKGAEWQQRNLSRVDENDRDDYFRSVKDAKDAIRWATPGWINKPMVVEWGDRTYCFGKITEIDPKTGFCHIQYKTGFEESIFIGSRKFHFLPDLNFIFAGMAFPEEHRKYVDNFFEAWPPVSNDNPHTAITSMQKQVPRGVHRLFCNKGRTLRLDPRVPYYGCPSGAEHNSDPTHCFEIKDGTSARDPVAEKCFEMCETHWNKKIVRVKQAESLYERQSRPCSGYTYLGSPSGESLVAAIWSLWRLNAWEHGMMIKFFLTKPTNRQHVTQRRKGNGSMVVAHLLDMAFSRYDVDLVVTCSQQGEAQQFWGNRGFRTPSKDSLRSVSRVPLQELNPFSDTVLMAITRKQFCDEYLSKDASASALCFKRWSKKHRKKTRTVKFFNSPTGESSARVLVHSQTLPMY